MNQYELALVVSAKVEDDVKAATLEKAQKYITRFGGVVTNVEDQGKKRLAYEIQKMNEVVMSFFHLLNFVSKSLLTLIFYVCYNAAESGNVLLRLF